MRTTLLLSFALLVGCGPSDRKSPAVDGGNRADGDGADDGTIAMTGTVWAPGNAPGMVPPGHEIPVYNALVYLTTERPAAIPQEVYCEPCTTGPVNSVATDHKGNFTLPPAPAGETYWLVIQKGQFRLEQEIEIGADLRTMPATMTTLPSESNPDTGKFIPKIALASGGFDQMESIFGKLHLGQVDSYGGFLSSTAAGHFDVYSNGGAIDGLAIGTLTDLVSNLETMMQYHIIFIPCSFDENTTAISGLFPDPVTGEMTSTPASLAAAQQNLKNIRDYVKAGGRLYVADWSGEWMDMPFPAQIQLNDNVDTPAEAYDPESDTWDTSLIGSANDGLYSSYDAEVTDPDMFQWLDGQAGPAGDGFSGGEEVYDAASFETHDNWNVIVKTNAVQLGVDEATGEPVIDEPRTYVIGDNDSDPGKMGEVATFEPAGCGRVLYTTFHSVPGQHVGLVPQERILAYLLMEIGVCKDGPVIE